MPSHFGRGKLKVEPLVQPGDVVQVPLSKDITPVFSPPPLKLPKLARNSYPQVLKSKRMKIDPLKMYPELDFL